MKQIIPMLLLALACFAIAAMLPGAIDKETAFHENIRIARCERGFMPGYCKGVKMAEAGE